ncbi:MAG: hypothetical protein QOD63_1722, partial [Actinomycetota bacterium]|nr:hypothetical protein [Actinomycetota bacterium]
MTAPRLKRRGVDAGDLLKGVAALAAIVVLLVGVPVLALPRLGWPLPHGIPTPAGAVDALVHRGLSFAVVIRAAAAVLWMAWVVLSSCVVVEAVAWVRRREARPLRGLGGVQSLAYSLVTCAVLVVPSLSHLGAPAAAAEVFATRSAAVEAPVDRARPAVAEPSMTAAVAADAASTPSTAGVPRAYVVQRYDCLWDLAEKHLGDPLRWRELEALTAPVVQPDGGRLGDPNLIYPGWTVLFPSDAVGLDEVVETPSYAAPPAAADSPRAARVGLDAGDPQEDVAAPPASGSESPVAAPDEVGATPTTSALSPPSVVDGRAAVPRSSAAAPATGPATPARPAVKGPALGMSVPAAAGVGVSALVGGIFVFRMFREGLGAHRRRRRGRDLVQPEPDPVAEAVERRVRAIASVDTVFWVDATLRYATAVLAEADGGGVQGILCVRPGQLGMEVVVDPPADTVGRFESADGGRTWTLDPDIELGELQDLAWGQALVPALCSVGATADGPVLVDLEQAGVLSVEGDPGWVEGYLAGAALEIAGAPWTADTALYLLHGDERLAVRELVEVVKDEHAFLSGLGRISSLVDDDELAGIASTLAARVAPGNAEGWFPTVVVACPGTDPVVVAELARRARPRRSGLALVGPGPLPGARWRLLIGADGHGVLEPLGLDLDARVDAEVVGTLVGRLSARAEPAD